VAAGSGGLYLIDMESKTIINKIKPSIHNFATVIEYIGSTINNILLLFEDKNEIVFVSHEFKETERLVDHHADHIWCIKYVPQHNYILSGGCDKKIKLTNASTLRTIRCYKDHTDKVTCFQVLDNETFVSSSYDFSVKMWNFFRDDCVGSFTVHTKWINSIVNAVEIFHEDLIITAGSDKKIGFLNRDGEEILALNTKSWVYRIALIDDLYDNYFMFNVDGLNEINLWKFK
jgi:WD40 repeat protein